MCVSGVDDGEQPYKLTWDKLFYTLDSLFCAYFCLVVNILPGDGVLGQQEGFLHLRAAFPWPWSRAACSRPWAAQLPRVPKHQVTSGYVKYGNSWAETLPLSTLLEARG